MQTYSNDVRKSWRGTPGSALLIPALLAASFAFGDSKAAEPEKEIDREVVESVLARDWKRAEKLLEPVGLHHPSPVLRLLKGHVCLAVNRCNEAVCFFWSVSSEEDLGRWEAWSREQRIEHPDRVMAGYLHGDSLARRKMSEEAVKVFTAATEAQGAKPDPLVLNARGVVQAIRGRTDDALCDFIRATEILPDLADAHCNLGILAIQVKEGAQGAIEDFDAALRHSPDYSLAFFGRGCVKMVLGKIQEAKKDMREAATKAGCTGDMLAGLVGRAVEMLDEKERRAGILAQADGEAAGFSLQTDLQKIRNGDLGPFGWNLQNLLKKNADNPAALQQINSAVTDLMVSQPRFGKAIQDDYTKVKNSFVQSSTLKELVQDIKTSAGFTGIMVAPGAALKGDLGISAGQTKKFDFSEINKINMDKYNNILDSRNKIFSSPAQGFRTDAPDAVWEEGDWPFSAEYGLLYRPEPKTVPPATAPKSKEGGKS